MSIKKSIKDLKCELDRKLNYRHNVTRIVEDSVSGIYNLDHFEASDWKLTLTADTTLTESNLPTGTETIEFTIKITGNFALTLPAYWTSVGDAYDGTVWNFIAFQVHNGNPGSEEVTVFVTNLP